MAYSPTVQYEGYKRLDFALSASSSFSLFYFIFLFFLFCYIEKLFFFSFTKLLPQAPGAVAGQSGRTLSSSSTWCPQHSGGSGEGCLETIYFLLHQVHRSDYSSRPAPSPVQMVLASGRGQPRGQKRGEGKKEQVSHCPQLGQAPLRDLWGGGFWVTASTLPFYPPMAQPDAGWWP